MTPRTANRLAIGVDVVAAIIWLSGVGLLFANSSRFDPNTLFLLGLFGATAAAYAVTGTLIERRDPSNVIAWLCVAMGPLLLFGLTATEYAVHALIVSPGSLPAADAVVTLAAPTPLLAIGAMVLILTVFPTGRTLGGFWRLAAWTTASAIALGALASFVDPHMITNVWANRMEQVHLEVPSAFSIDALDTVGPAVTMVANAVFVLGAILAFVSLLVRRSRADAETRAQLRWLAYVVIAVATWIVVMVPIGFATDWSDTGGAVFWLVVTPLVALGGPIAIGIAILRYRLWDIDVVIKKTVVFAMIGAGLTLVSLGALLLFPLLAVGEMTGWERGVFVVGIVLGTLFGPLRRRARRIADRLVYGRRATPYEVLTEFSSRVGETYASDDVLPRMAHVLKDGAAATSARVQLRVGSGLRDAAVAGTEAPGEAHVFPVLHQGEELGALSVTMPPNDPLDAARARLVRDLAAQAGPVLRNVRLIEELRASRQRLVVARDEERRRLERNIHDGAQQQLVALSVQLKLLETLAGTDEEKERRLAAALAAQAGAALEDLRDLARGIYPPLLADRGLAVALAAQARKAAVPTTVTPEEFERFPQEIEAAVYFCALEALNNVAKYARASTVTIELTRADGLLTFAVRDDGEGFDPAETAYGTGLQGMADRLDAIGGSLTVTSTPGAGSTITGTVPVEVTR